MSENEQYAEGITNVLQRIKQTVMANGIQPDDLFEIWCAGITAASILSPGRVGTAAQRVPAAEKDAAR